MSFFYEDDKEPYLSGKTVEELDIIKEELTRERIIIEDEKIRVRKSLSLCDAKLKEIDKNIKIIFTELKRREDIEEAKTLFNLSIEGIDLLSKDELLVITKNMDRTDYRKNGVSTRFRDFERICKEVINTKKKYSKWTLTSLLKEAQYDTFPPSIIYRYEYKDEDERYFYVGGINII